MLAQRKISEISSTNTFELGTTLTPTLSAGAARGTRTPDPVITNDVLYQLSYCGGPWGASGRGAKTLAPDIGRCAALQEPARLCASGKPAVLPATRAGSDRAVRSPAPPRQKAAPAAGLGLRRIGWLGEFRRLRLVCDPGIVGRAHDGNDGRNRGRAALPRAKHGGGFGRRR